MLVRDLKSRNGSLLNGREIKGVGWVELRENDCLDLCGYDFRLMHERVPREDSGSCVVDAGSTESRLTGSRSISITKHQLEDSQRFSQLLALLEITRTLRDVLQAEDVLERAVAMLFQIFPAVDRAAIGFIKDNEDFTPKWWQLRDGDPESVIRISQTIVRHLAETSQAVLTNDALADFANAGSVHALAMRSVMCAPLIDADEHVFGLIHVDAGQPNMFNDLDLEVLASVAMQLALAINFSRLHAIAVEDAILRVDVKQASAVQRRFLPDSTPTITGYDLAGFYRAARHVGGDYIDYIPLQDGRLAIVLGDVVGKGVPAALTMVQLAIETRASLDVCKTPSQVMTRLNRKLASEFITMVVLLLDPATHTVTIANAGHESPLLRTADGLVDSVGFEAAGFPLSVVEDYPYEEFSIQLSPGDRLVVFSDGFPDAEHKPSGRRFGSGPISKMLGEFDGAANAFIECLVDQVDQFTDGSTQFDDMCMVCLRRTDDRPQGDAAMSPI